MKWYNVELFDAQEICHLKAFLKELDLNLKVPAVELAHILRFSPQRWRRLK